VFAEGCRDVSDAAVSAVVETTVHTLSMLGVKITSIQHDASSVLLYPKVLKSLLDPIYTRSESVRKGFDSKQFAASNCDRGCPHVSVRNVVTYVRNILLAIALLTRKPLTSL